MYYFSSFVELSTAFLVGFSAIKKVYFYSFACFFFPPVSIMGKTGGDIIDEDSYSVSSIMYKEEKHQQSYIIFYTNVI